MYQRRNKNKVNIFVRECIQTALFELMRDGRFEDVTISEIIKKAGVSRMGFYRNYADKKSVVEDFILTVFERTVDEIKARRSLSFKPYNIICTVLENFKKNAEYMHLLIENNLDYLMYDCYKKTFALLTEGQTLTPVRIYYYDILVANLFAIEFAWVKNGMRESPEVLARIYSRILALQSKI